MNYLKGMSPGSFSDNIISILSITVAVYQQIRVIQCKQNKKQHGTKKTTLIFKYKQDIAENVQNR